MSRSLLLLGTQDPARPEQQDEHQDAEGDDGLKLVGRQDAGPGQD
jgi:hypothetical protein